MERIYLKLYDPADTYLTPASTLYDAAGVRRDFPAVDHFPHIVQTDASGEMVYSIFALNVMKAKYGIEGGTPAQAVRAIENAMNAEREQQEAEAQAQAEMVTPEERIAAALEFQALASLPDMEEE